MTYIPPNENGQATMANSAPVVIASDQSAVPVSATDLDIRNLTNTDVVTAELSATDNAVLDAIAASVAAIDTDATTIIGHVDGIETLATATNTKLDTVIGHVDGIETTLTTIDGRVDGLEGSIGTTADAAATAGSTGTLSAKQRLMTSQLDSIKTAVETIDNAISGSGVNISQLNGVNVTMGNGASGTGVQRVTLASDSTGQVAVTGNALTALQLIDDTVFADDAAVTLGTSKGNVMAGVAVAMDGTDPTAVSAEGDAAALRSDPNRILLVNQTHPRFFRASVDYASAQTNATVQAAPGAGLSLYITDIIISNGATAGKIQLLDGSGGSAVLTDYPAINGGLTATGIRNPIKLTTNTLLAITSTTVTTHTVTVTGYIAA